MRISVILGLALLVSACSATSHCSNCQTAIAEAIWGFHEQRLESLLLSWEKGAQVDGAAYVQEVAFFETTTGIELTEKGAVQRAED